MPPTSAAAGLDIRYHSEQPSAALQDVLRFAAGDPLGCRLIGPSPRSGEKLEDARLRYRAIEEHEFFRDGCHFAADLASVDGALVLGPDLTLIGFGAHITYSDPIDVRVLRVREFLERTGEVASLRTLGTRHNSAARFCWNVPATIGFIVSQDGIVTCLHREVGADALTMWRPLDL